jgi:hypothetical protein
MTRLLFLSLRHSGASRNPGMLGLEVIALDTGFRQHDAEL